MKISDFKGEHYTEGESLERVFREHNERVNGEKTIAFVSLPTIWNSQSWIFNKTKKKRSKSKRCRTAPFSRMKASQWADTEHGVPRCRSKIISSRCPRIDRTTACSTRCTSDFTRRFSWLAAFLTATLQSWQAKQAAKPSRVKPVGHSGCFSHAFPYNGNCAPFPYASSRAPGFTRATLPFSQHQCVFRPRNSSHQLSRSSDLGQPNRHPDVL